MAKSRRVLRLVHLLGESGEGLTLDEMAAELAVNRRTAERLRDVIRETFDLEELADDRRKRFRIPDGLRFLGVTALTIENGAARLEDIRTRFGDGVARIVAACTDNDSEPKPPWRARKQVYLALSDAFAKLAPGTASHRFARMVDEMERLA